MSFIDKYTEYFIKMTGGEYFWKHYRRSAVRNLIIFLFIATLLSVIGSIIYGKDIKPIVAFVVFLVVFLFGFLGRLSKRFRNLILLDNYDLSEAKYVLYFFIYLGLAGMSVALLAI